MYGVKGAPFRYKGAENYFKKDPDMPVIMFAPHSNWWDGIVGYHINNRICKTYYECFTSEYKGISW